MKKAKTDLEMMKDPNSWPNWPFLPMVNRTKRERGMSTIGIWTEMEGGFRFLPNANIFQLDSIKASELVEITAEQLLSEGWEID